MTANPQEFPPVCPSECSTSLPVSETPDPDVSETLDQLACENWIATGTVTPPVFVVPAPTDPTSARLPLSAYVEAEPTRQERFQPALEVDQFRWPSVCDQLADQHPTVLDPVVEAVREAVGQGRTLIGFLGAQPRAGCTTMLLSVARCLAASGNRVAVVDADFATAALATREESGLDLASQLGLVATVGWEDVLAGRVPLAEGVIQSATEPMAVLPILRRPNSADESLQVIQTHGIQASVTAGVLREHYDVVLVDLGCATQPVQVSTVRAIVQHCRLDATLIVTRESAAGPERLSSGVLTPTPETICLGVVENWVEAA